MDGAGLALDQDGGRQAWAPDLAFRSGDRPITIGLVNNMPDAALSATEGQFRRMIQAASAGREVRVKLFSIPEIARSDAARDAMARYASTETLGTSGVDGLLVTGAEPLAADLRAEPYWASLAALADWAAANTVSTVWSCLAAHAAVLHLDGLQRRPLPVKCSGVFDVQTTGAHLLTSGQPKTFPVPHSRLNTLDEADLQAAGYTILSRSDQIGVDAFMRDRGSLFLFLQGHPEYDTDSLALEYRRDVRRFLIGERKTHPSVPAGYFGPATEQALLALASEAMAHRRPAILSECAKQIAASPPLQTWAASTGTLYANWLNLIAERADGRMGVRP